MSNAPYLGLDIGLRRTGVALSEAGMLATPLTTIAWTPPHAHGLIEEIVQLALKYEVKTIVAGLPLQEDGEGSVQSFKTTHLIELLHNELERQAMPVSIVTINEFYSTQEARARFPDVDKDAAAAAVILQQYLESV